MAGLTGVCIDPSTLFVSAPYGFYTENAESSLQFSGMSLRPSELHKRVNKEEGGGVTSITRSRASFGGRAWWYLRAAGTMSTSCRMIQERTLAMVRVLKGGRLR